MKKTYQPFIIKKAEEILEALKEDITPSEHIKNRLCDVLTEKFIKGELSADDDAYDAFDESDLISLLQMAKLYEDLNSLIEKGFIGMLDDDENSEASYFLTEKGKLYMEGLKKK
jgi:hypothetical protein